MHPSIHPSNASNTSPETSKNRHQLKPNKVKVSSLLTFLTVFCPLKDLMLPISIHRVNHCRLEATADYCFWI